MLTRRSLIANAGAASAFAALESSVFAQQPPDYRLGEWTGDSFASMHAIRDGAWNGPLPAPERRVELAIVGGGLAGLCVATLLADRDLILLEREAETGGVAKSGRWRDVEYALGSAYFVDLAEPFGSFYDRIGLAPRPVPEPAARLVGEAADGNLLETELRAPYEKFAALIAQLARRRDFPTIPIDKASDAALALDNLSLEDFLRREHVDPRLSGMLDAYSLSALGAPAAEVSAYAGVCFLSEIAARIYAFPGGNAAIARAMSAQIARAGAGRILGNAAVFAVEPSEGGLARIGWFDARAPGERRCIEARWVVIAAPYYFAARLLRGADAATKAQMSAPRQGSFLVANCCFEGPLDLAYESWTPQAASFGDVVNAAAVVDARSADGGVLTVYAPFRDPRAGRTELLAGDCAALAAPIVEDLRRYLPEAFTKARLAEVRLTRWGHHHLIAVPGVVATMRALGKRFGNVVLAHSDGQGMPAVESAITEAHRAVEIIAGG